MTLFGFPNTNQVSKSLQDCTVEAASAMLETRLFAKAGAVSWKETKSENPTNA